jgi:hypothetical protein
MRSEDVAFARLAAIGPSAAEKTRLEEINKGIDATMRDVIRDRYNPNALDAPMVTVTPQGAAPAKVPGEPSEPWKPMHPVQDWIRLGSTVQAANVESAEKALREAEPEEPEK